MSLAVDDFGARPWTQHTRRGVSTPRVCGLTGVTYRQLDYWCRIGLVTPTYEHADGPGTWRDWSMDDVRTVGLVASLIRAGARLPSSSVIHACHDLLASIDEDEWATAVLVIPATTDPAVVLITEVAAYLRTLGPEIVILVDVERLPGGAGHP